MHRTVMLSEATENLKIDPSGIYIDATFGRGGHSRAILNALNENGKLFALDKDPDAAKFAKENFADETRFKFIAASFDEIKKIAELEQIVGKVAGILFDLGVSSPQLDNAERGFSFLAEGPLDMRMNNASGQSAAVWLATAKENEIADVLWKFGEERFSRRIAKAIVAARKESPLQTTTQLAAIVSAANPRWEQHKHPATRSFQAIRIFINNELTELEVALSEGVDILRGNGRLVVISFHSLEDRIVKRFIRKLSHAQPPLINLPSYKDEESQVLRAIGRSIKPSAQEVEENPRSRSAIMRVAEKTL